MASKVVGGFQWLADDATGDPVGLRRPSDGKEFPLVSGAEIYINSIPIGIPGNGNIGNNGAYTAGGAFSVSYTAGIWLYFPANAIAAGSAAGLYWTVMTTTTVGTIYNNVLPAGTAPYIVTNPTPFVTTGPGNYTQTTASAIPLVTVPIAANSLSAMGVLTIKSSWAMPSDSNTKRGRHVLGGTTFKNVGFASNTSGCIEGRVYARGATTRQFGFSDTSATDLAGGSGNNIYSSLDMGVAQNLVISAELAVATNYMILEAFDVSSRSSFT